MFHGLPQQTIDLMIQCFQSTVGLQQVRLYGSRALGNYRNGSDIDLAVWFDRDTGSPEYELKARLEELPTPYKFDVTNYPKLVHQDLKNHINRIGKTLYKKGEETSSGT